MPELTTNHAASLLLVWLLVNEIFLLQASVRIATDDGSGIGEFANAGRLLESCVYNLLTGELLSSVFNKSIK